MTEQKITSPNITGMSRRRLLAGIGALALAGVTGSEAAAAAGQALRVDGETRKPNIVLIVLDDLGYGEIGSYGQKTIKTPVLDRLAAEGLRFTQAYANPTCAPSRASLLTGLHTGHSRIKGNGDSGKGLVAEDVTVAETLRAAGYATSHIGKWGFGPDNGDNPSHPNSQGYDHFFGYITHGHAHDYWPTYLWRDAERITYPENEGADVTYAGDLFTTEALDFIDRNHDRPFFLNLNYTTPHGPNEVPSDAPYTDENWPQPERNHAAQITWTDGAIGKVLDRLELHGVANDTLVVFTSDNGPHALHGVEFFDSNGPLRGTKFTVYEGGIRVPLIVRLPASLRSAGAPTAGSVLRQKVAVWDFLPTLSDVAGGETPAGLDGISFLPALTGKSQPGRPYLYWQSEGGDQAVRFGRWKAVRRKGKAVELYDLWSDLGESKNIASSHPNQVRSAEKWLADAVVVK
ncbi:arylsulfatase [Streptomyces sp. NPDC047974]|uniref:arylsulfatase n=1 Tax=Streptomyces sp. NPDC047974 TaxID=3154343 RepID=UPI0033C0E076